MGNMKLSIVIPTYNQGCFIGDCLSSIQNQTFRDFQVIIQDSNSSDETEEVCSKVVEADSRFLYFREKDEGQSDAINRGLARSTGEMWTWICSDDLYADSRALEKLVEHFQKMRKLDEKVIGVFGDAQYVTESGQIMGPYYNLTQDLTRDHFQLNWPLSQPSSLLLRQAVSEVGGVDKSLNLGMDLDLFLKILEGNRTFVYVSQMTVNIRVQPNSKSVKFRKKTAENALMIVRKHFGDFGNLQGSAYFAEYKISRRLELKTAIGAMVPFSNTLLQAVGSMRNQANLVMHPGYKKRKLKDLVLFSVWTSGCAVQKFFFTLTSRPAVRLMECMIRAKAHFIK
jgi:glycosyltransferase involved in cell wall biosynthesis